jgi:hypothetical protein
MKHAILPLALFAILAYAQQQQPRPKSAGPQQYPEWEVKVVHPHEVAAGRYQQVRPYELDTLAQEGWELVSMSEYVLRNEEREGLKGERPMVTQAYHSYAFKRLKRDQFR